VELNDELKEQIKKALIHEKMCVWCERYKLSIEGWYKIEHEHFVKTICNHCGHIDTFTTVPLILHFKREDELKERNWKHE